MGVFALPASAAPGDTGATFAITGGALTMTVPSGTANLGSVAAGSLTTSGALGATSVSDQRGALAAAWTVTVSSSNFVTGGATADETIANANVSYASGAETAKTGTGVFAPTLAGVALAAPVTGAAWAGVGVNTASWNPTISVTLLNQNATRAVVGTYTGTINQTVA